MGRDIDPGRIVQAKQRPDETLLVLTHMVEGRGGIDESQMHALRVRQESDKRDK